MSSCERLNINDKAHSNFSNIQATNRPGGYALKYFGKYNSMPPYQGLKRMNCSQGLQSDIVHYIFRLITSEMEASWVMEYHFPNTSLHSARIYSEGEYLYSAVYPSYW